MINSLSLSIREPTENSTLRRCYLRYVEQFRNLSMIDWQNEALYIWVR